MSEAQFELDRAREENATLRTANAALFAAMQEIEKKTGTPSNIPLILWGWLKEIRAIAKAAIAQADHPSSGEPS